ncbi:MAG: methyl-accepting chemotaxis protein [Candidatus Marinarcus sp.]|uniref:methyl-accepting chemotaxis protein n=1 Tax=Candidatus Marinarcus sp. TaxID=3100987 RepID=UPI003AFFF5DF
MFNFIKKKISNKIIFSLLILMTLNSFAVIYFTTKTVNENAILSTKINLDMLNTAMFQSLRNAMNTGDPTAIKKAEDEARSIAGVKELIVAKGQPLIEMYAPNEKLTENKDILNVFKSKEPAVIENKDDGHELRMIKPMIATEECLMCHGNQAVGDVIGVMDLTFSLGQSDDELRELTLYILVISTILGWVTIILILIVVKKTTNPIIALKNGFENLILSNDANIKLQVTSSDEIGDVAALFNRYMDKVQEGLKQDEKVIEEANDILEKTGNGFFVYSVKSKANNPYVEDLKNKLNNMILNTKETLDKINTTLREYSESKFDFQIDDKGLYGDLGSVASGIKLVGNNTSEILAMIMNTGDSLNQNTQALSDSSANLSKSSNQQASSLEETAAALEEITANIKGNTEASTQMAKLAQNVTKSAQNGLSLANETARSMDDINTHVSSINEAIEVIDQIAFQTNILSLNAAVEAATAGEAGKGFAVVAQEVRNLASRSAEAAKEIKDIVENASSKAFAGKEISAKMIEGYEELNSNIKNTIDVIENVANASKEQERGIVQINDAVASLDKATQENATVADTISNMSEQIAQMSNALVTAASRASFLEESRNKVCNVDLVYDTAKLKVDILKLKDSIYGQFGSYAQFTVAQDEALENWIAAYVEEHPDTCIETIQALKENNKKLNEKLQRLVNANSNKEGNDSLNEKAKEVEATALTIFGLLNTLKEENCKNQ